MIYDFGGRSVENAERFAELCEKDIPIMAEVFRSAFGHEPWNEDWSDEERLNSYLAETVCAANSLCYGLFVNGRLAAVSIGIKRSWWEGTNYVIEEFCVSHEVQGTGVGSRFIAMIGDDIGKRGFAGIYLQTDKDKPSYGFYRKNGFELQESRVSFYKSVKNSSKEN